jgi:uncharacterized protein
MLIDLKTISTEELEINETLDKDWWQASVEDAPVLGLATPLRVRVKASKVGDKYLLAGHVSGAVSLKCDRCLEAFRSDLEIPFSVFLVSPKSGQSEAEAELLDEDLEVDFIHGETLDLDATIKEQIFLSLPMKSICKEECLGLCLLCGANLNEGPCHCSQRKTSLVFSKLESLKIEGR